MIDGCGLAGTGVSVVNAVLGGSLPPVESLAGVILTGSPAMVTDRADWMQSLAGWTRAVVARNIPLLGVCFGHQLLAQAMGGGVDFHPQGREIGTVRIALTEEGRRDCLFGHFPELFTAHVTHAQTVTRLPANARRLAGNRHEAHQAFRVGDCAWGVQFHPEFTVEIMRAYVSEAADSLSRQGHDVAAIQAAIGPTGAANALLKRFYVYCAENENRIRRR